MIPDSYEIYRLTADAGNDDVRYRPYRYLQENQIRLTVDHYDCIYSEEMRGHILVKTIREHLETDPPTAFEGQPLCIGDVITVTADGITAAYYVDPTRLILLPTFFHQPGSSVLISIDTENWLLDGRKGNWMTVDTLRLDGQNLFLMQSQDYGRDAPYVIVDEQGNELAADKTGFTEETLEQIRKSLKEIDARLAAESMIAPDKKPKLEIWQQYFENGEYLRAEEISEEQNYNMIDGTANNRALKRSVLERLQEKKTKVNMTTPIKGNEVAYMQDDEMERINK